MNLFDICLVTASTARQAADFEHLLQRRIDAGLYPREIRFIVAADPEAGRVGSGGGTLHALLALLDRFAIDGGNAQDAQQFFSSHRVAVLHAGGASRRQPLYAPEGKLFAPLPLATNSAFPPVVLDLQLSLLLDFPWRPGEVVVTSGDVVLQMDTEGLERPPGDIQGFAAPASFAQGERHGVFVFGPSGEEVVDFHQKAAARFLEEHASLEGTASCAIDTGLVSFGPAAAAALAELGQLRRAELAAGRLSFDIYRELMIAALPSVDFERYLERVGGYSSLERDRHRDLYDRVHPFGLSAVLAVACQFLHFGSLPDYPVSCRRLGDASHGPFYLHGKGVLEPAVGPLVAHNCIDSRIIGGAELSAYAENLCSVTIARPGKRSLFAGIHDWAPDFPLPDDVLVEERTVRSETGSVRIRIVCGTEDSFQPQPFLEHIRYLNGRLVDWLEERGLDASDVFPDVGASVDLLEARLFTPVPDDGHFRGWIEKPDNPAAWKRWFLGQSRFSLSEAHAGADVKAREEERITTRRTLLRQCVLSGAGFHGVSAAEFGALGLTSRDHETLAKHLATTRNPLLAAYRRRILADSGVAPSTEYVPLGFVAPTGTVAFRPAVKEDQIVWARAPVRLDLAGGWSDTPPYTNRYGGRVVNVAVDLNGQPPIQVFVRRLPEPAIRFTSVDLGISETVRTNEELRAYHDPSSSFTLPRAALVLLGLADPRRPDRSLRQSLDTIGCGIDISLLCAVPKGSGLGTSSILGGVILAGLHRFFGIDIPLDDLYMQVLALEQMMTTGGGWQDQVGGLCGGVKDTTTRPGLRSRPVVRQLDPYLFEHHGCVERMTLFYTGFTRLAKNILQEVVDGVNRASAAYLFTHDCLKALAAEACDAFAFRDLDRLAGVIHRSLRQNNLIHPSTLNAEIEGMIERTRDLFQGMKLLGAGGGGFALFISKDRRQADDLRDVLRSQFEDDRARLVDFQLDKKGLEVTVS